MAKEPPENVHKLIAKQQPKPKKAEQTTLPRRFKRRPRPPKPKAKPKSVLALLAEAFKRKEGK